MPDGRGTVLVVDDDPAWIETLSAFLEEEGYSLVAAANGRMALDALPTSRPFVVVTDLDMPEMDGRQLLLRLRAEDARLPVIVVTAERTRAGDATLAAAFRVVHKLVATDELAGALAAAKAHRVRRLPLQKLWQAARTAPPSRVRGSVWRRTSLRRRVSSTSFSGRVVALALVLASSAILLKLYRSLPA